MGTVLDTLGSFIISGFIILGLLGLNASMNQTSFEMTSSNISQESIEELILMIRYDFSKMGHGVSIPTQPIISMTFDNIIFRADIDNDGSPEQLQYSISDSTAVPSTQNPRDCFLYRTVGGANPVGTALGVTDFSLTYYDEDGNQTASVNSVRSIEVKIIVESLYPSDGQYHRSERLLRITPMPLQL